MASAELGWRVVVRIGSGQPELLAALAALPARARAERLRQLALVGLYSLRCGASVGAHARDPKPPPTDTAFTARRERLMRGLAAEGE
ncbi:hypothetical protein [Thiococcus pfennigii]|uniref:hypothetical protein n=1 Tax=Thiococcus pfennigii TaxID=1057 RepID=UPI001905A13D|nr:hypothetical protein [Thiococcus pfennigii]MBK1699400.1 hypothetical protein [Thiococcus pfennigii]